MKASQELLAELRPAVGDGHVLTDAQTLDSHATDWSRRFRGEASAVVRPATTDEVARVLAVCHAAGQPVVPQGGNTGLVGGSIPREGAIVLSTRRLTSFENYLPAAREVTVGAGLTAAALNERTLADGLQLGVDLASRGSATIGGMVATNAGGIHVIRHGMMRSQIIGLEAVTAAGGVIDRMFGVVRDNTGYDLANLLAGSEGTLAVITRVRLRLVAADRRRAVALLAFANVEDAVAVAIRARWGLRGINAAEVFFAPGLDLVCAETGLVNPFAGEWPVFVLLEAAGEGEPAEALAAFLDDGGRIADSAFAIESRDCDRLWAYRERHTEAINAVGVPHKLDIALPLPRMAEFVERAEDVVRELNPKARAILFGHVGDGNLHVNLLGFDPDDEAPDDAILRLVAEIGGSISAEHGVGYAKRDWVHLTRTAADIEAMQGIKRGMDPRGILNPGVIVAAE